ncbi:MAG: transposase [Bacteriovoracaceae bacterium]
MPRPLFIRSEIHPYHVIARCNHKDFFPIHLEAVWEIMVKQLKHAHQEHQLAIHAFVLMGNHFHLLCHTPGANLDKIMHGFQRQTSIRILSRVQSENHLWGGRYKWSLIQSQQHYYQVYRYIFQNPIRAGLVNRVEDYPYSTISREVNFPLHSFIPMSFAGREGELLWLNQIYEKDDEKLIRGGLRKSQFDVSQKKIKAFGRLGNLPSAALEN